MKKSSRILAGLALASYCLACLPTLLAQGTAFTYQGRLNGNGAPANGNYDLRFILFDADPGGSQQGLVLTNSSVAVTGGLFTVSLDFGQSFPGADRWLEIAVRTNGAGAFTTLSPRQKITTVPYAITAANVTGVVPSSGLSGIYSGVVSFTNSSNQFAGNGTGLTNVNAGTLAGLGPAGFWKIAGNAGTSGGLNFVGTTDNQPLEFKVNNLRALRIEPATNGAPNVIAGAPVNTIGLGAIGSVIAGGGAADFLGVAYSNAVSGNLAFIGGGIGNNVAADGSVISGGVFNAIGTNSSDSVIAGGDDNSIAAMSPNATIGGGTRNLIENGASEATVGGGYQNDIQTSARWGVISGGFENTNAATEATIGGGYQHTIQTNCAAATIGGGFFNQIRQGSISSVIAGGENLIIFDGSDHATIGGGLYNHIERNSAGSGIFCGENNDLTASNAVITGGINNFVDAGADFAAVGGGAFNDCSGKYATIPGGQTNKAGGDFSFAAGRRAKANHTGSFVWADSPSSIGADFASTSSNQFLIRAAGGVGIGTASPEAPLHVTEGSAGAVTANANSIAVFEKSGNGYVSVLCPSANESGLLFGNANTNTDAAIVYNNASARGGLEFRTGTNQTQMTILANGNIGIGTLVPSRELEVQNASDTEIGIKSTDTGGHLWTLQSSSVTGNANLDASFQIIDRNTGGGSRLLIGTNGNVGIGITAPTNKLHVLGGATFTSGINGSDQTVSWAPGGAGWTFSSDRNLKDHVRPVDPQSVLERVSQLPIAEWNYRGYEQRHIGPMAQDFHQQFPLNENDKVLNDADLHGVALAAIQGLNHKVEADVESLRTELKRREAENAELKEAIAELKRVVEHMNEKIASRPD